MAGSSQSISSKIQNSAGTTLTFSSYTLDFSLGELSSIKEFSTADKVALSTGFFHSTFSLVTALYEQKLNPGEYVIIAPNPASTYVTVKAKYNTAGKFDFKICDINGVTILKNSTSFIHGFYLDKINLTSFASGTYFLYTSFDGLDGVKRMKILKLVKL